MGFHTSALAVSPGMTKGIPSLLSGVTLATVGHQPPEGESRSGAG